MIEAIPVPARIKRVLERVQRGETLSVAPCSRKPTELKDGRIRKPRREPGWPIDHLQISTWDIIPNIIDR